MSKKKYQPPYQPPKNLDITYWPYQDGSVGAFIDKVPGAIYGQSAESFAAGMKHVFEIFIEHHKAICASGETSGALDLHAEMLWIDDRLCVRWLAVPGFGIDFANEEELEQFVKALFIPPDKHTVQLRLN